ncbi:Hsp20/alpha crystallin family protein [Citricoccus alkalitolerans]|uniref:Hsp20/alpha crystallin family protein n=1 Tax=Citricoccus alkalitolerans TaxID=246603 RepID=A0ABV8XVM7_9MICC
MGIEDVFREFDRLASGMTSGRNGLRSMPMDLYRDGEHYVLAADLPGVDPGSIDIDVDGQVLTIRAERTLSAADGVSWLNRERQGGSFLRQLSLGEGIDMDNISAHYANGVLSVTLPVTERAKSRKIEIITDRDNVLEQDVTPLQQHAVEQ